MGGGVWGGGGGEGGREVFAHLAYGTISVVNKLRHVS